MTAIRRGWNWLPSGLAAIPLLAGAPYAGASEIGDMVKLVCMGAVQAELQDAGKVAPAGMASFACGCVAERLSSGSSLDGARSICRQLAAKRYPL